jgi:hypothetical protein
MEVSGQLHAPAALPPGKEPPGLLDMRLGVPQGRSGQFSPHLFSGANRVMRATSPIIYKGKKLKLSLQAVEAPMVARG